MFTKFDAVPDSLRLQLAYCKADSILDKIGATLLEAGLKHLHKYLSTFWLEAGRIHEWSASGRDRATAILHLSRSDRTPHTNVVPTTDNVTENFNMDM